jgi:hypothetical protein
MYNLKNLDPIHKEALDNATGLLKMFMERQEKIRQMLKGKIPLEKCETGGHAQSERTNNAIIIDFIQWIRYFMWGNSPEEVGIKVKNINRWVWTANTSGPHIYPWTKETLKIEDDQLTQYGALQYKDLIHQILDLCVPARPKGLFGLIDGNYGSITLDNAIEEMKKEMGEL